MTAAALAQLTNARRFGEWWRLQTICHGGDGLNLSFRDGDNGGIVFCCHSQHCDYSAIKAAIERRYGIRLDKPTNPSDRARLRREREQREAGEAVARRQMAAVGATADALRQLTAALAERLSASELGLLLLADAEADALAAEYHAALDALHELEAA